jgi:DNA-directed RNA polymerase subunit RPC12/RpoP
MSEEKKEKTKGKRCSRCGFRIRGKNHEEGVHHQQGRNRTTGNHLRKS